MFTTGYDENVRFSSTTQREWFLHILRRALTKEEPESVNERLHPSSASVCSRRNYLQSRIPMARKMNAAGTLYTAVGTAIHESLQNGLVRDGQAIMIEPRFALPEYRMSGRIDFIGFDVYTRRLFIADFKTTKSIPRNVKESYKGQLAMYALLTGITDCELVYISRNIKNPPSMKTFTVNLDDGILDKTALVIGRSLVAMHDLTVPERLSKKSDCTFCPFIKSCWPTDSYLRSGLSEPQEEKARVIADELIEGMPYRLNSTIERALQEGEMPPEVRRVLMER